MGDAASGILRRVCLRCVLGLFLRTRGFVGLLLVVTGADGAPTPSVPASSPSEVGKVLPLIIVLIDFFKFLMAVFLSLFLSRWMLSIHSCANSLLCCCSVSVSSWQCCGNKSCDVEVRYALVSGM